MKKNKYQYLKVLQQLIEGEWYDTTFYDKNDPEQMRSLRDDIRSYRESGTIKNPCIIRVINRRVPAGERVHA